MSRELIYNSGQHEFPFDWSEKKRRYRRNRKKEKMSLLLTDVCATAGSFYLADASDNFSTDTNWRRDQLLCYVYVSDIKIIIFRSFSATSVKVIAVIGTQTNVSAQFYFFFQGIYRIKTFMHFWLSHGVFLKQSENATIFLILI